jgi:hypothetical protein
MKTLFYRKSDKCSDTWEDEASQEYINRPVHLIREADKQCMACLKTYADSHNWVREYQERLGKDWRVVDKDMQDKNMQKVSDKLNNFFSGLTIEFGKDGEPKVSRN